MSLAGRPLCTPDEFSKGLDLGELLLDLTPKPLRAFPAGDAGGQFLYQPIVVRSRSRKCADGRPQFGAMLSETGPSSVPKRTALLVRHLPYCPRARSTPSNSESRMS